MHWDYTNRPACKFATVHDQLSPGIDSDKNYEIMVASLACIIIYDVNSGSRELSSLPNGLKSRVLWTVIN